MTGSLNPTHRPERPPPCEWIYSVVLVLLSASCLFMYTEDISTPMNKAVWPWQESCPFIQYILSLRSSSIFLRCARRWRKLVRKLFVRGGKRRRVLSLARRKQVYKLAVYSHSQKKIILFELLWYKLTFIILDVRIHQKSETEVRSHMRARAQHEGYTRAGHNPATLRDSSERLREQ